MSQKIAVLGSNSFSGSHFIDLLLEKKNYQVIGISRSPEKEDLFLPYKRHKGNNFRFYQLDLNKNMNRVLQLLDSFKPDYIVNFAGLIEVSSSWQYPEQYFTTNTLSIVQLVNQLKKANYLKRYLHISTPEVYGSCVDAEESAPINPSTPYAASKAAADLFLTTLFKQYHFPLVFTRATNVYGEGQQPFRLIPKTIIFIKQGLKIPLHGGGKAVKSFIHIKDVVCGYLLALKKGKEGTVYHFSPDEGGKKVRDIVFLICGKMGTDFNKVIEEVPERLGQDACYILNSTYARNTLGWRPTITLEEGIMEVISWVNNNWPKLSRTPLEYSHKF